MSLSNTLHSPPNPWSSHFMAVFRLGLPLVGAQLAQSAIGTTDTVMIGWLGARELAAGVLGAHSMFFVLILGAGFAMAAMPMIAQAKGSGDERAVRRAARMSLWVTTGYAALMMVPLWHMEGILVRLGQEAELAHLAGGYIRIIQWSLFPALYIMCLRSFLSAIEHARIVLIATVIMAVVNGFLNYALIFGNWGAPALGLKGAAIASVLSTLLAFGLLVRYATTVDGARRYDVLGRIWRPDWSALREVLHLGWPVSLTLIAEVGLFSASSIMMGWIGTIPLASHGIALQIAQIAFMIPLGFSMAATVLVGQASGRNDPTNLRRSAIAALAISAGVALANALILVSFPSFLAGLFLEETNPDGPAVLAYAVSLILVAAAFQLFDGLQAAASGLLRGIKDMRASMVLAVVAYWVVGMPLAYLLAFRAGLGGVGLWVGLAIGLAAAAFPMTVRFFRLTGRGSDKPAT